MVLQGFMGLHIVLDAPYLPITMANRRSIPRRRPDCCTCQALRVLGRTQTGRRYIGQKGSQTDRKNPKAQDLMAVF